MNRHFTIVLLTGILLAVTGKLPAQEVQPDTTRTANILHSRSFVDENGDGYNDLAPDHDGDGIPNGLDPDFLEGQQHRRHGQPAFLDLDGDGINDYLMHQFRMGRFHRYQQELHHTGGRFGTGAGPGTGSPGSLEETRKRQGGQPNNPGKGHGNGGKH